MKRVLSGLSAGAIAQFIQQILPITHTIYKRQAVLDIYNERIGAARQEHDHLRLVVLLRNMENLEFTIFERPINQIPVNDYERIINNRKNLEGYKDGKHIFTWQPHGSQFTIKEEVPTSATRFRINQRPDMLPMDHVLRLSRFKPEWIEIL